MQIARRPHRPIRGDSAQIHADIARRAGANMADQRGRATGGRLERARERVGLVGRHGHQQAAGRLRVAQHAHAVLELLVFEAALPHEGARPVDNAERLGRAAEVAGIPVDALEQRQVVPDELGRRVRGLQHLVEVAGQPEARHVGGGVRVHGRHRLGARTVELHHGLDDGAHALVVLEPGPERRVHDPRAEDLRVEQRVARLRASVAHDAVRVHGAEHRQAVLRLVVLDGVAAHHERARLAHLVGPAAQHLAHHVGAQTAREREDVERRQRLRPHGEHVGQRVRRGDGAELVGVVRHRREEVERQHRGRVVVQAVDGGVVGRVEAQQQIGVGRRRDVLQYLFEVSRTPLRRSTALLGEAGEPYALGLAHGIPFA